MERGKILDRRMSTYALLHEGIELALILNVDELLAAVGRVGNVQLKEGKIKVSIAYSSSMSSGDRIRIHSDDESTAIFRRGLVAGCKRQHRHVGQSPYCRARRRRRGILKSRHERIALTFILPVCGGASFCFLDLTGVKLSFVVDGEKGTQREGGLCGVGKLGKNCVSLGFWEVKSQWERRGLEAQWVPE